VLIINVKKKKVFKKKIHWFLWLLRRKR